MSAAEAPRYQADTPAIPEEAAPAYGDIAARSETIIELIVQGALDPIDGLWLAVAPSEDVLAAEGARRREEDANRMRRRYSDEARARAVALVAGGASCRMAAAAVLGDAGARVTVWRWARKAGAL